MHSHSVQSINYRYRLRLSDYTQRRRTIHRVQIDVIRSTMHKNSNQQYFKQDANKLAQTVLTTITPLIKYDRSVTGKVTISAEAACTVGRHLFALSMTTSGANRQCGLCPAYRDLSGLTLRPLRKAAAYK